MYTLIEYLYRFAHEERVRKYLDELEFNSNTEYSARHYAWLEQHLDSEALQHLLDYQSMQEIATSLEEEALFRAGLALGLELARL